MAVDPDLQKLRPYVTIFINKELKALRNYPPYEYNWDTTTVANGSTPPGSMDTDEGFHLAHESPPDPRERE